MSATQLERLRTLHEDVEVFLKAAAEEVAARSTIKQRPDQIKSDHVAKALVDAVQDRSVQASALHEDEDLRDEIRAMTAPTGSEALRIFQDQLQVLRQQQLLEPVQVEDEEDPENDPADMLVEGLLNGTEPPAFSGEEGGGRFLDLHACHSLYLNLRGIARVTYTAYLTDYAGRPEATSMDTARTPEYGRYIAHVLEYLTDFLARAQPLVEANELLVEADAAFAKEWDAGNVARWQGSRVEGAPAGAPAAIAAASSGPVAEAALDVGDLSRFKTAADMEAGLGAEQVKVELQRRGLKCGGRPSDRTARLFACHALPPDQVPAKHRAKGGATAPAMPPPPLANGHADGSQPGASDNAARENPTRRTARLEARVMRLWEVLQETVDATVAQVEKMQSWTYEEMVANQLMAEVEDGEAPEEMEDEEEEQPIYNPKNLPIGWDGKPIPYWLYKLHGLNLEYKCEICGNQSYWGPREFERHFQEVRHASGMRCLGIPNSKAFHGVTMIDDAYSLYQKLQKESARKKFNPELEEEYEDSQGNVMPKKTYEDLARQGLL